MNRLEYLFAKALDDFHVGSFAKAEVSLKKLNKLQPGIPDVLHLLGLIALETDRPRRAVDQFARLIKAEPGNPGYHGLYGSALFRAGMPERAVAAFDQAIRGDPAQADLHYNRALALNALGEWDGAESGFREALQQDPGLLDAQFNLGQLLRRQGRLDDALSCFESVTRSDETAVDSLIEMGEVLNGLSRFDEAVEPLGRAIARHPDNVQALHALGIACFYRKRYAEAERCFSHALALAPESFQIHNSLGNLLVRQGRLADAERCFRDAMALQPNRQDTTFNLSNLLLLTGAFDEGWRLFESMRGIAYAGSVPHNMWNGGDLTGKTIRIYGDQGIGDVVMFAGLLPLLQSRAARCVAEVDERLAPLFKRSFPQLDIIGRPRGSAPSHCEIPIDVETTFSELPRHLRPDLDRRAKPKYAYLQADPAARDAIRRRYKAESDDLLIGVAWQSHNVKRPERDAPLSLWGPVLALPNARFISLQYGASRADIAAAAQQHGTEIFDDPEIDQNSSLDDLASQISALDLVISISQSSAHFAGALGKAVFTMLPKIPDWRYQLTGDDATWYPAMRLYRQSQIDDWSDVIDAIAADAKKIVRDAD